MPNIELGFFFFLEREREREREFYHQTKIYQSIFSIGEN